MCYPCWEAVAAYEKRGCRFIVSVRKTSRLVEQLKAAEWKSSPKTDADGECEFRYQPEGWGKAYRFLALRYKKKPKPKEEGEPEQYQLFDTPEYSYRMFVTSIIAGSWPKRSYALDERIHGGGNEGTGD